MVKANQTLRSEEMNCSKCEKEIPVDTKPSENWQYYCADCGLAEALKEIGESKKYYGFENETQDDKDKSD